MKAAATGDVACELRPSLKEDVALLKRAKPDQLRFLHCWPRIQPDAPAASNPKGLDYYSASPTALEANPTARHPLSLGSPAKNWKKPALTQSRTLAARFTIT